jgi:hypothetical protein
MRKLFILGVLLLLSVTVLGPSQGQAFNSATHVYIAERVFPFAFDKINLYYGSIAPDIALYVPDGAAWTLEEAFMDTHYNYIYLPYTWWKPAERAFAKGWQTHNEIWGADYYAHKTPVGYNGYVNIQAERLANIPDFEILRTSPRGPELAHFAIEVAIDLLLVRYHEPGLGLKLLWAAKYRSQKDVDLMVSTFATDEQISDALKAAEYTFRGLVIDYATALALPDPLRMLAISELGVQIAVQMGVPITPYQAWEILRVAMYLCQDSNYMGVIQYAIERIGTNPDLIR